MLQNGAFAAFACLHLLVIGCGAPSGGTASSAASGSQSAPAPPQLMTSGMVAVGSGSPYYAKLAAIDAHSNEVSQVSIDAMQRSTSELERICPDSPDRIGDMLVAGQREMRAQGKETSLQQLAVNVSAMLTEAERSGGIPKMSTCAEPITLWVMGSPAR